MKAVKSVRKLKKWHYAC